MWLKKLPFFFRAVGFSDIEQACADADMDFAIWLCTRYLKKKPDSVPVVLTRARCYEVLRKKPQQWADVEWAYAMDDTFVPGIYTYAMLLLERCEVEKALPLFAVIKDHPSARDGVDAALSEICMRQAQADLGCEYQLRSWLHNFDNIRFANGNLFRLTYSNATELLCAQEHKFWADTLLPVVKKMDRISAQGPKMPINLGLKKHKKPGRKKIGYWGSDYKEHSVRYFSRPLIESHDHDSWEVFILDDNFGGSDPDQHTRAFHAAVEHYYDISKWSDDRVVEFILFLQLDVLVDLQGHTSANRLHLWQQRLARLQITGLAYPPTTGLSGIDYKMVDVHMLGPDSHRYYAEKQMVMPESFWCFDPKEDAYYTSVPPNKAVGHLTYASMGNGAKITEPIMRAWARILEQAPNVRLLVVSHTFGDALTIKFFQQHMKSAGVDMSRLTCKVSFPRDELWQRYGEVDLVLDTFPFNGGTTSCWATYAGVPVLTMAGKSLASCMGKSIMTNLGFPEFVLDSLDDYVTKAVEIARQPEVLERFRACARERFQKSSLGNGKKFAAEFETACDHLLNHSVQVQDPDVPPLALAEMLRRARLVWYYGNVSACERIVALSRKHYGDTVEIDELVAESLLGQKEFSQFNAMGERLDKSNRLRHLHVLYQIATNNLPVAENLVRQMLAGEVSSETTGLDIQRRLWSAWLQVYLGRQESLAPAKGEPECAINKVAFWIVGDADSGFEEQKTQIEKLMPTVSIEMVYEKVEQYERADCLNKLLQAYSKPGVMVVLVRHGVEFVDQGVLAALINTLKNSDMVGAAGALRWSQKDWTLDLPEFKSWGLMRPSRLNDEHYELHFAGIDARTVVEGAAVLDGKLLAFLPERFTDALFDDDMGDPGLWIEEDWSHRAHLSGKKLVIHRGLGVVMRPMGEMQSLHTAPGQKGLLERIHLDPLRLPIVDYSVTTVQVTSAQMGVQVAHAFLQPG